jgi:hypothetical protein
MKVPMQDWYTPADVARIFKVPPRQVLRWCAEGRLLSRPVPGSKWAGDEPPPPGMRAPSGKRARIHREIGHDALADFNATLPEANRLDFEAVFGSDKRTLALPLTDLGGPAIFYLSSKTVGAIGLAKRQADKETLGSASGLAIDVLDAPGPGGRSVGTLFVLYRNGPRR